MALDPERNEGYAGVIVYAWPEMHIIEKSSAILPLKFPYIPGLLSFREIPVLGKAIEELEIEPDLFFVDGQGIAHPRSMGIACHLGLLLEKPTIGCAKSLLYGSYKKPGQKRGDSEPLYSKDKKVIGQVLRTKLSCNPLFISPGHLIDLETSVEWVLRVLDGYRLPKPTREADAFVGELKREGRK
ncbi:MAG: endonuclease V [Chlamydiae bacterium]|nr:endonuclease V [Chlamydiota bacterium]MBI3265619.1 endonuclease V [Chlamydiota bacterium]